MARGPGDESHVHWIPAHACHRDADDGLLVQPVYNTHPSPPVSQAATLPSQGTTKERLKFIPHFSRKNRITDFTHNPRPSPYHSDIPLYHQLISNPSFPYIPERGGKSSSHTRSRQKKERKQTKNIDLSSLSLSGPLPPLPSESIEDGNINW